MSIKRCVRKKAEYICTKKVMSNTAKTKIDFILVVRKIKLLKKYLA